MLATFLTDARPTRGVVVVEAHLESEPVLVGGATALASRICDLLDAGGVPRRLLADSDGGRAKRQAHGIADVEEALERTYPELPLAFVSITDAENTPANIAIGKALRSLRREGVTLVGSGLPSFHNFGYFFSRDQRVQAAGRQHGKNFDDWLRDTLADETLSDEARLDALSRWADTPSGRHAHPENGASHLMPLMVLLGAADGGKAVPVYEDSHRRIMPRGTYQMTHFWW